MDGRRYNEHAMDFGVYVKGPLFVTRRGGGSLADEDIAYLLAEGPFRQSVQQEIDDEAMAGDWFDDEAM